MRSTHAPSKSEYAPRIEVWLTRPRHLQGKRQCCEQPSAAPAPRQRRPSRSFPSIADGSLARLCRACRRRASSRRRKARLDQRLDRRGPTRLSRRDAGARRQAGLALALEVVRSGPFRVARFMGGRHANGNFPPMTRAFAASATAADFKAISDGDRPGAARHRHARAGAPGGRSRRRRQSAARAAASAEPQPVAGRRSRRRLRRAARRAPAASASARSTARRRASSRRPAASAASRRGRRERGRRAARRLLRHEGIALPQDGHRQCLRRAGGADASSARSSPMRCTEPKPSFVLHGLEVGGKLRAVTGSSRSRQRLICEFGAIAEDELAIASPGDFLFFENIEEACRTGLRGLRFQRRRRALQAAVVRYRDPPVRRAGAADRQGPAAGAAHAARRPAEGLRQEQPAASGGSPRRCARRPPAAAAPAQPSDGLLKRADRARHRRTSAAGGPAGDTSVTLLVAARLADRRPCRRPPSSSVSITLTRISVPRRPAGGSPRHRPGRIRRRRHHRRWSANP